MKLFSKILCIGLCAISSMSFVDAMDRQLPDDGKEKVAPEARVKRTAEDAGFDSANGASASASGAPVQKAARPASTWQRPSRSRVARLLERVGMAEGTFALSADDYGIEIPLSKAKNAGTIKKYLEDRELLEKRIATLRYVQENIDLFARRLTDTHKRCLRDLGENLDRIFSRAGCCYRGRLINPEYFLSIFVPAIEVLLRICECCPDPVFAMELLLSNSCPLVGENLEGLRDKLNQSLPGFVEFFHEYEREKEQSVLENGFLTWFDEDAFKKTGLAPRLINVMGPLGLNSTSCRYPRWVLRVISDGNIARIKSLHPRDCLASFVMRLNRHSFMQLWSAVCDRFVQEFDVAKSAINLQITELEKDSFKLKLELRGKYCYDVASLRDYNMRQLNEMFGRDEIITFLHDSLAPDIIDLSSLFVGLEVDVQPILEALKKVLVGDDVKDVAELFAHLPNAHDAVKALLRLAVHLGIQTLVERVKPYVRDCGRHARCDLLNDYYLHTGECLFGDIEQTDVDTVAARAFSFRELLVNGALIKNLRNVFNCLGVDMALHQRLMFEFGGMFLTDVEGIESFCFGMHFLSRTAKSLGRSVSMNPHDVELVLTRNKIASVGAIVALRSPTCALFDQIALEGNPLWKTSVTSVELKKAFGPLLARGCLVCCDRGFKSRDNKWEEDGGELGEVLPECDVCREKLRKDRPVIVFSCGVVTHPHFVCEKCFDHFPVDAAGMKTCHQCRKFIVHPNTMAYGEYKRLYHVEEDHHSDAGSSSGAGSSGASSSAGPSADRT